MERKDVFFISLFAVSFLISVVVMSGDYLCNMLEKNYISNNMHQVATEPDSQLKEELTGEETNTEDSEYVVENNTENNKENKTLEFETVDYDYFDDALFIGDSRTVGIMEYGNLENSSFFADSGMSVFGLEYKKIAVADMGKVTFDEVLENRQYGKIYLMLGLNELGYRFDSIQKKYQETVDKIRMYQEDAIIYLCANMHVTEEQSSKDAIYNNENINRMNNLIASFADGKRIFYLDINELFDDDTGSLSTEYSSDASHILGKYYVDWVDWLCTKAIVTDAQESMEVSGPEDTELDSLTHS